MKKHLHKIAWVEPGSIAEELGLEPGDAIEEINGNEIEDIFDYQYYVEDEYLDVLILTKDGEECVLEIEKDEDEDLGITFESSLMDEYHSCCNKCMFCFIDQMPPGMRDTLYFKDDDSRLSFLQGNYVTLTNMTDEDVERIITYKLAPSIFLFIRRIRSFAAKCFITGLREMRCRKSGVFMRPGLR